MRARWGHALRATLTALFWGVPSTAFALPLPIFASLVAPILSSLAAVLQVTPFAGRYLAGWTRPFWMVVGVALVVIAGLSYALFVQQIAYRRHVTEGTFYSTDPPHSISGQVVPLERQKGRATGVSIDELLARAPLTGETQVVQLDPKVQYNRLPDSSPAVSASYEALLEQPSKLSAYGDHVVLLDSSGGRAARLARAARRAGVEATIEFVIGGFEAWRGRLASLTGEGVERISAAALWQRLWSEQSPLVVDARTQASMLETGFIDGARHRSVFAALLWPEETLSGLPRSRSVVVTSYRELESRVLARIMAERGYDVRFLAGGLYQAALDGYYPIPAYPNRTRFIGPREHHRLYAEQNDVVFLDLRGRSRYQAHATPGSINVPVLDTDPARVSEIVERLPLDMRFAGLVHDRTTGLQAMRVGRAIEASGGTWLGLVSAPHLFSYNRLQKVKGSAQATGGDVQRWWVVGWADWLAGVTGSWALAFAVLGFGVRVAVSPLEYLPRARGWRTSGRLLGHPAVLITALALVVWLLVSLWSGLDRWLVNYGTVADGLRMRADGALAFGAALLLGLNLAAVVRRRPMPMVATVLLACAGAWVLQGIAAGLVWYLAGMLLAGLVIIALAAALRWLVDSYAKATPSSPIALWAVPWCAPDIGRKASMLGWLMRRGVRVPAGYVVTARSWPLTRGQIKRMQRRLCAGQGAAVIVRSAAVGEDDDPGAAGMLASEVVTASDGQAWCAALERVWASMGRAGWARPCALVQRYVEGERGGVASSHAPRHPADTVVDSGVGDDVTSGRTPGASWAVARAAIAARRRGTVEQLVKWISLQRGQLPTDVEWVERRGATFVVQARDGVIDESLSAYEHDRWALARAGGRWVVHPLEQEAGPLCAFSRAVLAELYRDVAPTRDWFGHLWTPLRRTRWREELGRASHGIALTPQRLIDAYADTFASKHSCYVAREGHTPLGSMCWQGLIDCLSYRVRTFVGEHGAWGFAAMAGMAVTGGLVGRIYTATVGAQVRQRLAQWPDPAGDSMRALQRVHEGGCSLEQWLARYGDVAACGNDWDVAAPRARDEPGRVRRWAQAAATSSVERIAAGPWERFRESVRQRLLQDVALQRQVLLEIGRRIGADVADVASLRPDELEHAARLGQRALWEELERGRQRRCAYEGAVEGEVIDAAGGVATHRDFQRAVWVSGPVAEISGPVRYVASADDAQSTRTDEVAVLARPDPGLLRGLPACRLVLAPRGAMTSHGAVVARAKGQPAIFGVSVASCERVYVAGDPPVVEAL